MCSPPSPILLTLTSLEIQLLNQSSVRDTIKGHLEVWKYTIHLSISLFEDVVYSLVEVLDSLSIVFWLCVCVCVVLVIMFVYIWVCGYGCGIVCVCTNVCVCAYESTCHVFPHDLYTGLPCLSIRGRSKPVSYLCSGGQGIKGTAPSGSLVVFTTHPWREPKFHWPVTASGNTSGQLLCIWWASSRTPRCYFPCSDHSSELTWSLWWQYRLSTLVKCTDV